MKLYFAMSCIALFVLAGCGNSDYGKFVSACTAEGQSKKDCTCFADIAQEELSPEAFSVLVDATTSQDPDIVGKLAPGDAAKMFTVVVQTAQKCEISGLAGL